MLNEELLLSKYPEFTVETSDSRELAVKISGNLGKNATALFYESGSPGGRHSPMPRNFALSTIGICLISYDRPGYGGSDRNPGRSVADAASDVERIADELELDHINIFGRSGGVPHALASAALLGSRVDSVAGLVGIGPPDSMNFDNLEGMVEDNQRKHRLSSKDPQKLEEEYEQHTREALANPNWFLDTFLADKMTDIDTTIALDWRIRPHLLENYRASLVPRAGSKGCGWLDDTLAFNKPWGFELSGVAQPTLLWHGEDDVFAPLQHSRWLHDKLPNARLSVRPGGGHFDAIPAMLKTMTWQRDHRE